MLRGQANDPPPTFGPHAAYIVVCGRYIEISGVDERGVCDFVRRHGCSPAVGRSPIARFESTLRRH